MKNVIIMIVVALVFAGGGFYGGMQYSQSRKTTNSGFDRQMGQGGPSGLGPNGTSTGQGKQMGNNGTSGEIIGKDDKSLTLKLRDGGSKIVFYSDSTTVSKMATGSVADLQTGNTIMVSGETNSDGSVSAKTIDLRPASNDPVSQK